MHTITQEKYAAMERLSNEQKQIAALAIDQRGALKKMITSAGGSEDVALIEDFKKIVSTELTPYASSILLDPEFGLPAAKVRSETSGLLLAYEKTGYDSSTPGRMPDLLEDWSVLTLKKQGADAIKFLLYYDIDEDEKINERKHRFVERIGSECAAENIPFYLELVSYDSGNLDPNSVDYAKVKPHKVNDMMKEFSKPQYKVDVLKMEVPVNMNYVEGFGETTVYTQTEAANFFKEQSTATNLPFIFLSAGVSAELFKKTLTFAHESGSTFNGVLCGRATWANGVTPFVTGGETQAKEWMNTHGRQNIDALNEVLAQTAQPWTDKVTAE
ncbi:tagatose-bisphosphate aldolase [Enterococcus sp. 5H]|uniref:tagatose-bisphosphate aldolase n=1 Tax=Enterococcus sp. 5H TaxID=1229490 RepID=UPI002303CB7D|nr:tagatose-bisphosphate aldolase [Enterococcus sp. 5H]MDA9471886.1 Tagatose 1, 6-bisphosphate aldolase [Enterococcus sp. 5H]